MAKKTLADFPNLLKEWDYSRNGDLDPKGISFSAHRKVWWRCEKGHSWEALVSNRARLGRSCPYCSHQLPIVGENDLLTLYPEVVKELSPTKNRGLNPTKIMPGTHKEAWFTCPTCGNEYKMRIYHRTIGMGCPVCAHKKIIKGINDFGSMHPELAKEWHPTKNGDRTPYEFASNSDFMAWWVCPIGHEYKSKIVQRYNGKQCPICNKANKTSFPEQAILYYVKKYFPDAINGYRNIFKNSMELDIYIPSKRIGIEYDGMAWHSSKTNIERDVRKYKICKENDIYLIRVREKAYEDNIKACDALLVLKTTTNPVDLNREIYHVLSIITTSIEDLLPTNYSYDFNKQMEKMNFQMKLMDVDIERDRREIQKYLTEFEDSLGKHRPDLIDEWDYEKNKPLTPFNVKLNSNEKVWWKCKKCGHEWKASVAERGGHDKTNCPKCANEIGGKKHHDFVLKKKGSIVETHPHILKKWDYERNILKPEEVTAGSGEKAWWKCPECGYSWQTTISHMSTRDSGCPCCANKVCVPGINDVATKYPNLLLDWDYDKNVGIDPNTITATGRKIHWKCHKCGHEWESLIASRAKGTGCPKCAIERRKGNQFAKKK